MTRARAGAVPPPTTRVSTFELFFDLVFVLTIARIGVVLHEESDLVEITLLAVALLALTAFTHRYRSGAVSDTT
jgi:low temperature requirement protein LtrA